MRNLLITTAAVALTTGALVAAPTIDAHPGTPNICLDEHLTIISPCPPLDDVAGECYDADWALIACPPPPDVMLTVDGTDYPQCVEEDCSDQPGQVGVWIDPDTGTHWLSIGETSYQVQR